MNQFNPDETPVFSRHNYKEGLTEIRMYVPNDLAQVLDALALARDETRNDFIKAHLEKLVRWELHKHSVTARTLKGNPLMSEHDRRER